MSLDSLSCFQTNSTMDYRSHCFCIWIYSFCLCIGFLNPSFYLLDLIMAFDLDHLFYWICFGFDNNLYLDQISKFDPFFFNHYIHIWLPIFIIRSLNLVLCLRNYLPLCLHFIDLSQSSYWWYLSSDFFCLFNFLHLHKWTLESVHLHCQSATFSRSPIYS